MEAKKHIQPYNDRAEAGRELARAVQSHFRSTHRGDAPPPPSAAGYTVPFPEQVIGLCRGGVPVASSVARQLGLPMDFLVVRKIASPFNPELALGALAEGAPEPAEALNIDPFGNHADRGETLASARKRAAEELQSRLTRYRNHPLSVSGQHILLVDDGAATGATMRAAIQSMRQHQAKRVTVALPVAPEETIVELAREADGVICPWCPAYFLSVGSHYRHFPQVTDEEVFAALDQSVGATAPTRTSGAQPDLYGSG